MKKYLYIITTLSLSTAFAMNTSDKTSSNTSQVPALQKKILPNPSKFSRNFQKFENNTFGSNTLPPQKTTSTKNNFLKQVKSPLPNYKELEKKYPQHFTGFTATPFPLIKKIRKHLNSGKKITDPMEGIKEHLFALSKALAQHQDFDSIKTDIDKELKAHKQISCATYIYYIVRIAVSQGSGTQEEADLFKLTGFSKPYGNIFKMNFKEFSKKEPSNIQEFFSVLETIDNLSEGDKGDFRKSYSLTGNYNNNTVKAVKNAVKNAVKKNPYAKIPCFLPGSDILGYFYLAMTYAQGIHPIPVPFSDKSSKLHGISMSRWGQYCHDKAHSRADLTNFSAKQFAHNLMNYYYILLLKNAKALDSQEKKRKYAVQAMLPHVTTFATEVHEAYREALVEILEKSLKYLYLDKNTDEFDAFSVSAFLALHETPLDLSRTYGTSTLQDLLEASLPEKITTTSKEGNIEEIKNNDTKETLTGDIFETSYATGETNLSDEQIFNLVKNKPRSYFLGNHPLDTSILDIDLINGYEIIKNKMYIDVKITTIFHEELIYRQRTNYARRMNFKHDLSMLETAKVILKNKYKFDLPKIPSLNNYRDEKNFEKGVNECIQALDTGLMHLNDFWVKSSISLSNPNNSELSISKKFEDKVEKALKNLADNLPEWAGEPKQFIQNAVAVPKL